MFNNNNTFHDNHYFGKWKFAKGYGETLSFNDWRAAPFNQDANSTFTGDPTQGTSTGGGSGSNPSTPPVTVANDLNADTATLEGSIGNWQDWYSASASQSSTEAHSGTRSLKVDVTDPWGWGVQLSNWPGFATTLGTKSISLWGKLGSGTNIQPKMKVKWLNSSNAVLQSDEVTLPVLTTSWQKVSALVDAPAGAETVLVYLQGSGNPGDSVYLDDMVVGDAPNILDAATAGGEGSAGEWQSWYSATIAHSSAQAYKGANSLLVNVTDPWGWGVQLSNWPGFEADAGAKRISYQAKQGAGSIGDVTIRVKWFNASNQVLQADTVQLSSLTANWQRATQNVTAPVGTTHAYLDVYSDDGSAGNSLYLDDIVITNN
jgi:hypothetical protein